MTYTEYSILGELEKLKLHNVLSMAYKECAFDWLFDSIIGLLHRNRVIIRQGNLTKVHCPILPVFDNIDKCALFEIGWLMLTTKRKEFSSTILDCMECGSICCVCVCVFV